MKFCENCGAQLEDDAVFCEECGTKQVSPVAIDESTVREYAMDENTTHNTFKDNGVSGVCGKKGLKDWVVIALLVIFSPLILIELLLWLPGVLFWVLYLGLQIVIITYMWRTRKWSTWIKVGVLAAYVLSYFI